MTAASTTAQPGIRRLRVRYAKRGRLRFASHRDVGRAVERGLRLARVPVAFSAGFHPHPKISYAGAVATGTASEAEYLDLVVTGDCDPAWLKVALDGALPDGIDVLDVVVANNDGLADRLEASQWEVRLDGVEPDAADAAVAGFLAAERVEVERRTKKGRRRLDVRAPVIRFVVDHGVDHGGRRRADPAPGVPCAILLMVVRNVTPAVRPDDVLAGVRRVASLAPVAPPRVTRLAQGRWDEPAGRLADPLEMCEEFDVAGDVVRAATAPSPAPARHVAGG